MRSDQSGWFNYSPLDLSSRQDRDKPGADTTVGEVHLFFHSLQPGQVEIRFNGPPAGSPTDILRAAIRELETAIFVFSD